MIVSLTWQEQLFASQAGCMRRISAMRRSRFEPYGTPDGDLWGTDIESCGAEFAVSKAIGLHWDAVPPPESLSSLRGDVQNIEVRSTKHKDGHLIVHDRDKDDRPFVLVRGTMPDYEIAGWIYARDAKQQRFARPIRNGNYAYFVPCVELHDISEVPITLELDA